MTDDYCIAVTSTTEEAVALYAFLKEANAVFYG